MDDNNRIDSVVTTLNYITCKKCGEKFIANNVIEYLNRVCVFCKNSVRKEE